jgi:hypothetical protein
MRQTCLVVAVSLLLFSGCAWMRPLIAGDAHLDRLRRYAAALEYFNFVVTDYNNFFESADPGIRRRMIRAVDPLFIAAAEVLEDWKTAIDAKDAPREALLCQRSRELLTLCAYKVAALAGLQKTKEGRRPIAPDVPDYCLHH